MSGTEADVQARRARRAFVRAYHPDVGGDPAVFVRGLAELDRPRHPFPAGPVPGSRVPGSRVPGDRAPGAGASRVVFHRRPRGVRRLLAVLLSVNPRRQARRRYPSRPR